MITLIVLVSVFAVINRFSGGGLFWRDAFPGRPIYYSGVTAIIILSILYGYQGALAGASFLLWRLPGWYGSIDMGRREHTRKRDFLVMFTRGFVAFPVFVWMQYNGNDGNPWSAALLLTMSLGIALSYLAFLETEKAEWTTGALWGATLYLLLGVS
jgi:hypothetical protein